MRLEEGVDESTGAFQFLDLGLEASVEVLYLFALFPVEGFHEII